MKLNEIYLSMEETDELFDKLERYNENHSNSTMTAQQLAEKLLIYAIKYLNIDKINLENI